MKERDRHLALGLGSIIGLLVIANSAFTKGQRDAILRRDGNRCQFPMNDNKGGIRKCNANKNLAAHHIYPQRMAEFDGLDQDREVDTIENGITLCSPHHNQDIHPDMVETFADYGRQKKLGVKKPDSFDNLFKKRAALADKGIEYWDSDYDEYLAETAEENQLVNPQDYPSKNRRTTKNRPGKKWYHKLFD